jgi:hypothetical protein
MKLVGNKPYPSNELDTLVCIVINERLKLGEAVSEKQAVSDVIGVMRNLNLKPSKEYKVTIGEAVRQAFDMVEKVHPLTPEAAVEILRVRKQRGAQ